MCKKAIVLVDADLAQPTGGIFYTKDEEARHCGALLCLLSSTCFYVFCCGRYLGTCSRSWYNKCLKMFCHAIRCKLVLSENVSKTSLKEHWCLAAKPQASQTGLKAVSNYENSTELCKVISCYVALGCCADQHKPFWKMSRDLSLQKKKGIFVQIISANHKDVDFDFDVLLCKLLNNHFVFGWVV